MRKGFIPLALMATTLAVGWSVALGQETTKKLKVFISVDIEGVTDVINWEETKSGSSDYEMYRKQMTAEANAAIDGALAAGATEIVVRDSHGSARNILPGELRKEAQLIRGWSGGVLSMMEGIDKSFDAVMFVGYHARAGSRDAVLDHTMTGSIYELKINGKPVPEAGLNAAIAGYFGVPVVLVAGDRAVVEQAKELLGDVETVIVKEGIGEAAKNLHPERATELIRHKAEAALRRVRDFKPYRLTPPFTMEITFKDEKDARRASWLPGAQLVGCCTATFTTNDFMEMLKFFSFAH